MKQWTITVDGVENEVVFIPNQWSGRHKLTVNGQEVPLERKSFQAFVGLDQEINIAGKMCRFVLIGNKADIAVDGVYVDSKKEYVPLKNMPWWTWIFIVLCIAIPIVTLGGAVPMLLALLGAIGCVRVSINPGMKTAAKVFSCIGICALAWILMAVVVTLMASV